MASVRWARRSWETGKTGRHQSVCCLESDKATRIDFDRLTAKTMPPVPGLPVIGQLTSFRMLTRSPSRFAEPPKFGTGLAGATVPVG